MATTSTYTVKFRRKREGRTNYPRRLSLLLSEKPRLVIRQSLKNTLLQIIAYKEKGDDVLVSAHTAELKKYGWNAGGGSLPASYLCGILLAKKARDKKVTEAVADIGFTAPIAGTRIYATLAGAVDGGLVVPMSPDVRPAQERLSGQHIKAYAAQLKKNDADKYKKMFSAYLKAGIDPELMPALVEDIKKKMGIALKEAPTKEAPKEKRTVTDMSTPEKKGKTTLK